MADRPRPPAPSAAWLTEQLRRAEQHAANVEPLLVAAVAQVLDQAADNAARGFTAHATSYMTASAPGVTAESTMIALKPTPEQAAALSLDGGEDADTLHVTLAYLGETTGPLSGVVDALRAVSLRHASLNGTVGGAGVFADNGKGHPIIALPSVPGLVELRVAVTEALHGAGIDYARNYGYLPHMTLSYAEAPEHAAAAIGLPLTFADLLIVRGDVEVVPLPLAGYPPLTADARLIARPLVTDPDEERIIREGVARAMQAMAMAAAGDVVDRIAEVAERHAPDGGYGYTYWNAEARAVFWVCGDWTSEDEATAAEADFMAIDGVEAFEACWECAAPGSRESSDDYEPGDGWEQVYAARQWTLAELEAERFVQWFPVNRDGLHAAANEPAQWGRPAADEIIDVDALVASITERTKPVRDAAVQAAATPVLASVGIDYAVTNLLVGRVLAQSASQIVDIADTTQLNVMRIVRRSYEEGLSIPHTAEAIRSGMRDATPARATLIARTELAGAVNGGSLASVRVVEQATGVTYRKVWMTAPGAKHPRHYLYDGLNGQTHKLAEKFQVGGSELDHPGDPEGAPREICNCFVGSTLVAAHDARVGYRRRYHGSLVTVETDGEHRLSGTPNHPVLTDSGWKPLGEIREGDYLVSATLREDVAVADPHVDNAPAAIEEVVGALARRGVTRRVAGAAVEFHGDASADGQVDVVTAYGDLRNGDHAAIGKPSAQNLLMRRRLATGALATAGLRLDLGLSRSLRTPGALRGGREAPALVGGGPSHPNLHGGGSVARLDSEFEQVPADDVAADPVELGQRLFGDAFRVSFAQVVAVKVDAFHGDVFNLETASGAYIANGIVSHNCRCTMRYDEGEEQHATSHTEQVVRDDVSVSAGPPVPPEMVSRIDHLGLNQWPPPMGDLARRVYGKARDTEGLYKKDGHWTEARENLHDRIVAAHFEGKTPAAAGQPRTAYMTAGGGASGKSAARFDDHGRDVTLDELRQRPDVVHIDPDAIKEMLPEYKVLRDGGDRYAASGVHEESSAIAKRVIAEAQRRGYSTIMDTTGSGGSFMGKIAATKEAGYQVQVTMFSIPTNEAIVRAMARGERSGRYVAVVPLKFAHSGSARQMLEWSESPIVDRWRVYDNTTSPRLVAHGGRGETVIEDGPTFAAIKAKATETQ